MFCSLANRVNASLTDGVFHERTAKPGDKVALLCPGRGSTPLNSANAAELRSVVSRGFTVMFGTWGGVTSWGKDAAQTEAMTNGLSVIGSSPWSRSTTKVALLGRSMGGQLALLLALNNPAKVSAVAVAIPAVSPIDIHDNNLGPGYGPEIEAAYTNLAGWNAAKASHDPLTRAAEFLALGIPLHVSYSDDDPICRKAKAEAFIAASGAEGFNMGNQGHSIDAGFPARAAAFLAAHA